MKRMALAALSVGLFQVFSKSLHAQNIKMKIPSITVLPADGEDVIAFEISDTQHVA